MRPGSVVRFLGHWILRSALIVPGFALVGLRDKRLVTGSLAASAGISMFLLIYSAMEVRNHRKATLGAAHGKRLPKRQVRLLAEGNGDSGRAGATHYRRRRAMHEAA
jgi:hypothetical protein